MRNEAKFTLLAFFLLVSCRFTENQPSETKEEVAKPAAPTAEAIPTRIVKREVQTHEDDIGVSPLPQQTSTRSVVDRLPEGSRKEIFTELVKVQDRARREAEELFPTDANKISLQQLKTYDFRDAFRKNAAEGDKRRTRYEKDLAAKYKISDSQLRAIGDEGLAKNWPLP